MKFIILAVCVAVAAAKPHIYLYDGPASAPIGRDGRVIDTPGVAHIKTAHIAAQASASASSAGRLIPASVYGVAKPAGYQGPSAPLGEDGRVIDTVEVAQLKAERLAALEKAIAEAVAAESSAAAHAEANSVYGAPVTMAQLQEVPTYIMADPITAPVHQGYSGPPAPIGEDGRVIDTEEVMKLKAERLAALAAAQAQAQAQAQAEARAQAQAQAQARAQAQAQAQTQARAQAQASASASASSSSSSSQSYTYRAPAEAVAIAKPAYSGPLAPIGEDGRVVDTEEVANLKAEHLAALEKAYAAAVALAAATSYSMASSSQQYDASAKAASSASAYSMSSSSEGYTYNAPVNAAADAAATASGYSIASSQVVMPQQVYNGPPAPLGPDGRVIDTEEVMKLKAEHLAALQAANSAASTIAAMSSQSMSSSGGYVYNAPAVVDNQHFYTGPPAPLGPDGRVIDTEEVAKLKAEHLATLEAANAAAAAYAAACDSSMVSSDEYTENSSSAAASAAASAMSDSSFEGYTYNAPNAAASATASASSSSASSSEGYTYNAPAVHQHQSSIVEASAIASQQVYNGPPAPLGQDGRVIDTEEVANLKAEHLATLEQANAAAAAFAATSASSSSEGYTYNAPAATASAASSASSSSEGYTYNAPAATASAASSASSSSEGYIYNAPIVQDTQSVAVEAAAIQPQQVYNGPPAPLDKDGRVIDTEEVAKLKAEHLAAVEQANAAAAAFAAASGSSMSTFTSEGYTYNAPTAQDVQAIPSQTAVIKPHQVYNGPPAPLGADGQVIDTEEVAKLKAKHLAALEKANAAAIAFADASGCSISTVSSEGYTYVAPVVQHANTIAIAAPAGKPHQIYNGPPAPIGEDGRVIDTEEVAKLKSEHLATLNQAHAEASAFAAASSSSSSSESYSNEASVVPATTYGSPAVPATTYGSPAVPATTYGSPAVPATTYGSPAVPATTYGSPVVPANTYGVPAVQHADTIVESKPSPALPHHIYNGPPAPIGEDGRVIDTEEVAKLKSEHLATLNQAHAEAAAFAAASSSSSAENNSYEAPITPQSSYGSPATSYGAPSANSAQLKSEHLATQVYANAKAEASAATALSSASSSSSASASSSSSSSSAEISFGAPFQQAQHVQTLIPAAPTAKPDAYRGPLAPLSEDGQVIDTDEVARLKAERLATLAKATSKAVAGASAEASAKSEGSILYSPALPAVQPLPSFTAPVAQNNPVAAPENSHALVRRVVYRRPAYSGPFAPLGPNGRVVDTEEVAKLKAERLSTLNHATSHAIKLARAKKIVNANAQSAASASQNS